MYSLKHEQQYRDLSIEDGWYLDSYHPVQKYIRSTKSSSIVNFKNKNRKAVQCWCEKVWSGIQQVQLKPACVVRALSSDETIPVRNKSLDIIGEMLAEKTGCIYDPMLLGQHSVRANNSSATL